MSDTTTTAADKAASKLDSRKYRFGLLLAFLAIALQLADKLTPTLADFLLSIFLAYCGFNVTQKGVQWVSSAIAAKKAAPPTEAS